jgi:DNA repair protein RecN (Recombination protein N)
MLRLLRVRNFALIDELELEFDAGLNILSGETGAGKSLIVDALALIAGGKASSEIIRTGERRAIVEAVFDPPEDIDLGAIGIDAEDELVLRREISADNRNRVFINSQPSTVSGLKKIAPTLIDIHGQHEQQTLLDTGHQLALIDRAAGNSKLADTVRSHYNSISALETELASLEQSEAEILQRTDLLQFQRDEIERVGPQAGETTALGEKVRILEHSGKLYEAAALGYQSLYEAESSIIEQLAGVERALEEVQKHDARLVEVTAQAATSRALVEEVAFALRDYLNHLDALQTRLSELEHLHRKYGDDLVTHLETVIQEMDTIGLRKTRMDEVSQQLSDVRSLYTSTAKALGKTRKAISGKLGKQVTHEIRSLAMPQAAFRIDWTELSPGRATGFDMPGFMLAPNPGEESGPLATIASGGELSRTMLALRTVLSQDGGTRTLVFDEVDAGVGGEAAETVGRKLKGLSGSYQVLCVTHLAQIARFADQHSRIEKLVVDKRTVTRVEAVGGNSQVEELARMMSGPSVTDTARRHVRELLKRQ